MQTATEIRTLLAEHGLSPRHALGQNFLIDHNLLTRLVEVSGVGDRAATELVVEIGPGTGTLTEELLGRGCNVLACELDEGLADLLSARYAGAIDRGQLRIMRGDAIESGKRTRADLAGELAERDSVLVANLPYSIASPLMIDLAIRRPRCRGMYVTVQKEVAARVVAAPGGRDYGPLAILIGAVCTARAIASLPPNCFWPRPKVTSAMIAIERRDVPATTQPEALEHLCQLIFQSRRKQLGTVLPKAMRWPLGVTSTMRAEQCSIEQLVALAEQWRHLQETDGPGNA